MNLRTTVLPLSSLVGSKPLDRGEQSISKSPTCCGANLSDDGYSELSTGHVVTCGWPTAQNSLSALPDVKGRFSRPLTHVFATSD